MQALSSFTGDPEGYIEEGSENEHLSPEGPHGRTWRGSYLLGTLRGRQGGLNR